MLLLSYLQYFEQTCDHLEQRLVVLYRAIQSVVAGVIHLNFHHVKAHAKKGTVHYNLNNTEVDSMCTAVIKANDLERRIQGPSPLMRPEMLCSLVWDLVSGQDILWIHHTPR